MQTITKPKIIIENGKPSGVILKWKEFQEIIEKIEDIHDLSEIKKTLKKKPRFTSIDDLLKRYAV